MANTNKSSEEPVDKSEAPKKEKFDFTGDRPIWFNYEGEDKILLPGKSYAFTFEENSYIADLVTHGILKKVEDK